MRVNLYNTNTGDTIVLKGGTLWICVQKSWDKILSVTQLTLIDNVTGKQRIKLRCTNAGRSLSKHPNIIQVIPMAERNPRTALPPLQFGIATSKPQGDRT
jgi:hypothetical protein